MLEDKKTVGLYIHIPFCASKCKYCDFPSFSGMEELFPKYAEAVCRELEMIRTKYGMLSVDTVFFGGGTPSLIPAVQMKKIMETITSLFYIEKNAEITLEANPGTITPEKALAYSSMGLNRISIGFQAAQDRLLKFMGRIHSKDMFLRCIDLVKNCGFHNINADILFGVPSQTMAEWIETIQTVKMCDVTHISCYSLKIEEDTPWYEMNEQGKLPTVDEELERKMYHWAISALDGFGFHQYEISNFSKPGFESRHNLKYWTGKPYIGIGAAGHSFFENERSANITNPGEYIKKLKEDVLPEVTRETIHKEERLSEEFILGLRRIDGVSLNRLKKEFGNEAVQKYMDKIYLLIQKKLLSMEKDRIRLTKTGLDFANQVWLEFV